VCECCDEVVRCPVKNSAEPANVRGMSLGMRVVAVAQEPRAPRTSVAANDEQTRTAGLLTVAGIGVLARWWQGVALTELRAAGGGDRAPCD